MKKVMGEAHKQLVEARKKHYSIVGGSFDTLDNPRVALREIGDSSVTNLLATVKGLKKKDKVKGRKRKKYWVEKQGKKKRKQGNKENEPPRESENIPIQEIGQKDMETSQSSIWTNYEYDTSFIELLHGSVPLGGTSYNFL